MALPSKPSRRSKSEYSIRTAANALSVLEAFREHAELGVTELAQMLGLHKNNAFRLLATLEERGYVEQGEDDRYRLGASCQELGHAYARGSDLARHARQALEALCAATGESVHLGTLADLEVTQLDGEQPRRSVFAALRKGSRLPLSCTATGKALLAVGGQEMWERLDDVHRERGGLPRLTPRSIVDRDKLFDHLQGVASEGVALDLAEWDPELVCAAAPVFDASGRAVGALSVSAPRFRADPTVLRSELAPAVVAAAQGLSARLGYLR